MLGHTPKHRVRWTVVDVDSEPLVTTVYATREEALDEAQWMNAAVHDFRYVPHALYVEDARNVR